MNRCWPCVLNARNDAWARACFLAIPRNDEEKDWKSILLHSKLHTRKNDSTPALGIFELKGYR